LDAEYLTIKHKEEVEEEEEEEMSPDSCP